MVEKAKCVSLEKEKGVLFSQTSEVSFSAEKRPISDLFAVADPRWREEFACGHRSPIEPVSTSQSSKEAQIRLVLGYILFVLRRPAADRVLTLGKVARSWGGGFLQV